MSRSDPGKQYRKEKRKKEILRLRKRAQKRKNHVEKMAADQANQC